MDSFSFNGFRCSCLALVALTGCSLLIDRSPEQCATDDECLTRGPGYANTYCNGEGFCVARTTTPIDACTSNKECTAALGEPAICRTPGTPCVKLLLKSTDDSGNEKVSCSDVFPPKAIDDDKVIIVGWVIPSFV